MIRTKACPRCATIELHSFLSTESSPLSPPPPPAQRESPFKFSFFSLLDDHSLYLLYNITISSPPIGQAPIHKYFTAKKKELCADFFAPFLHQHYKFFPKFRLFEALKKLHCKVYFSNNSK